MKTPLAWRNLFHNRLRTLVAVGGIGFAVLLIFMQLGFLGTVSLTATTILDALEFDIALTGPSYLFFNDPGSFSQVRMTQAQSLPEVATAKPLWVDAQGWLVPNSEGHERYVTMVIGVDPQQIPFRDQDILRHADSLQRSDQLLFDVKSRPEFIPRTEGSLVTLGREEMTIAGTFALGAGFSSEGSVILGRTALSKVVGKPLEQLQLGLLTLRPELRSYEQTQRVVAALKEELPNDVKVWSARDLKAYEQGFWILEKSIGVIFVMGVAVAFLVGLVVVYQVLLSDISSQLGEYATLKAMGYSKTQLRVIVLQQATYLALMGYFPALMFALLGYRLTEWYARIPMVLTGPMAVAVLVLAVLMCNLAAWVSLQKVNKADPASLF